MEIAERLRRWMGDDIPRNDGRRQLHRLAAELRALGHAAVGVDADRADPASLATAAALATQLRDLVAALPDLDDVGGPAAAPVPASLLPERSPVSGAANPTAPPLRYEFHGDRTLAVATFGRAHEGPAGHVHGGVVAAVFDELLGVAQMASGAAGFTGTLSVRYRALTPLGVPIDHAAWVGARDGRRLTVHAESRHQERLLAEATGVFVITDLLPQPGS